MKKITKTVYQAFNGNEFETEQACRDYETVQIEYACEAIGVVFLDKDKKRICFWPNPDSVYYMYVPTIGARRKIEQLFEAAGRDTPFNAITNAYADFLAKSIGWWYYTENGWKQINYEIHRLELENEALMKTL